jgi:hypothetical protein
MAICCVGKATCMRGNIITAVKLGLKPGLLTGAYLEGHGRETFTQASTL